MLDIHFTLPGQAISTNSLYKRGRGGQVFLAPEAVVYRKAAIPFIKRAIKSGGNYEGGLLHAEIVVQQKFFNKDGTIKHVDLDNSLKNLLDSIFPVLGINDSAIFTIQLNKVHTLLKPKVSVRLWESPLPKVMSR